MGKKEKIFVKPLINFGIGICIPILLALVFGVVGLFVALANGSENLVKSFKFGAGVGLFLSLLGGLEIAIGLLFEGGSMVNRFWRSAGFLTIWGISISLLLNV